MPGAPERVPEQVHDLGIVLSRGQTIEHDFPLLNPTARPLRVLGAEALKPCCSEVVAVSGSIPARGEGRLSVRFKPGFQSGHKSVGFVVRTDRAEEPVWLSTLRAELVAEVQVATIEGEGLSLLMGESGTQVLRIAARRHRETGRPAPATVSGAGDARARFLGEPRERTLENGVVETTRDVVVEIPPRSEAGSQVAALAFGWADGRHWEHRVHWTVTPHLTAMPEALILRPGDSLKGAVMVRSRTSPFRVLGIDGAGVGLESSAIQLNRAAESHLVRLGFDRDRLPASGAFDVTIRTDHPDQPAVVVSVLVVSSGEGGGP